MKTSYYYLLLFLLFPMYAFSQQEGDVNGPGEANLEKLGDLSISLSVQDLKASITFYEKLGFTPVEGLGSLAQKWMIVSNGSAKLGLFQGFFPSNTITFNPTDARAIFKSITEKGVESVMQVGMDRASGPCSFSLVDPDGNPIVIDQH